MIPKDKRLELGILSKEVFGSASRWNTMMTKGELVSGKTTFKDGRERKCLNVKRYSLEEIEAKMIAIKVQLDKEKEDARRKSEESKLATTPEPGSSGTTDSTNSSTSGRIDGQERSPEPVEHS